MAAPLTQVAQPGRPIRLGALAKGPGIAAAGAMAVWFAFAVAVQQGARVEQTAALAATVLAVLLGIVGLALAASRGRSWLASPTGPGPFVALWAAAGAAAAILSAPVAVLVVEASRSGGWPAEGAAVLQMTVGLGCGLILANIVASRPRWFPLAVGEAMTGRFAGFAMVAGAMAGLIGTFVFR